MNVQSGIRFLSLVCITIGVAKSLSAQTLDRSGQDSTIFVSHTVFLPPESITSGAQNWCIESADLDGDGNKDLVVGSKLDGKAHIHLGNGDGRFRSGGYIPTKAYNRALILSDLDQDGDDDFASITMLGHLNLAEHTEPGQFHPRPSVLVGGQLQDLASCDIDRDGDQDLLVVATSANEVIFYRNEGEFSFRKAASWPVGKDPRSIDVGDINGDSQPDLVVGCDNGKIYLFWGESGGFRSGGAWSSGSANWAVCIADLNGDGKNDLATASYLDKWLSIHLNQGNRSFPISQQILSGDHNFDLKAADFDLDGDLDLVTCSTLDHAIGFHLNDGTGNMSERHELASGDWNAGIAIADVDQDGDPDLAIASINDHQVQIHRNTSIHPQDEQDVVIALTGLVIDGDNLQVVPHAPVCLKRREGDEILKTSVSDEVGKFDFGMVAPGSYVLICRSPEFPVTEQPFSMPESSFQQDIVLGRAPSTFLYGLAIDQVSRKCIPGATVTISDLEDQVLFTLTADLRGRYKTAIDPMEVLISATADGYDPSPSLTVNIKADQPSGTRADVELQPIPTDACLTGIVVDEVTEEPIPGAVLAVRDIHGNPVRKLRADDKGAYRLCLPFGEYRVSTTATGYFFKLDDIQIKEPEPETALTHDIYLKPLEKDAFIVLEHVYFDVAQATLRPESVEELERVVKILEENPSLTVSIEGHTDSDASESYNLGLSDRRSGAVVDYLIDEGIDPVRLLYEGFGESRPVVPNDSPENKQLNRRTEFRVVDF